MLVVGTETETRIGVMPGANAVVTEALVLVKVTPTDPGVRSDGSVPGASSTNDASLMYCGLFMPAADIDSLMETHLDIHASTYYIPSVSGQMTVVVMGEPLVSVDPIDDCVGPVVTKDEADEVVCDKMV